jgi:ABC-type uncharacterized transport system permease subunit
LVDITSQRGKKSRDSDHNVFPVVPSRPGVDFRKQLHLTLEICILWPSFLYIFTLIRLYAFAPCTQLIALSPKFESTLCFTLCAQLLGNPPLMPNPRLNHSIKITFMKILNLYIFSNFLWTILPQNYKFYLIGPTG